mmetsp:Transcript_17253/g.23979  ORF Transcript_17253/g.23979 Transcript_17253/m.23979 type:complete len:113 (-) Transcript_17253:652-990(-)
MPAKDSKRIEADTSRKNQIGSCALLPLHVCIHKTQNAESVIKIPMRFFYDENRRTQLTIQLRDLLRIPQQQAATIVSRLWSRNRKLIRNAELTGIEDSIRLPTSSPLLVSIL